MRQCVISRIGKLICHSGINTVAWRKAGTITVVSLIEDLRTKKYLFIWVSSDGVTNMQIKQMESCMVNVHAFSHLSKISKENYLSPLVT